MVTARALIVLSVILLGIHGQEPDARWAKKLLDVIKARDSYLEKLDQVKNDPKVENVEGLIAAMRGVPSQLKGIDSLDLSVVEEDKQVLRELFKEPEEPVVSKFFVSETLKKNYATRGLGFILRVLKAHYDYSCLQVLLSPPQKSPVNRPIPTGAMCARVKEDEESAEEALVFSTEKICDNVNKCSGASTPHPYGDEDGTSTKKACTAEGNKCNVEKAIPMMGALLWYKMSAFIARSFCRNSLSKPSKSVLQTELQDVEKMVNLISAFGSTLYWRDFFLEAAKRKAYSNLDTAMTMVKERENLVAATPLACEKLKSEDSCDIQSIHRVYQSLKKIKKERLSPSPTRNLRLQSKVDHSKVLELKTRTLDKIQLLAKIDSLDQNLRTAVEGISSYFEGLAKYDMRIASADVTFLKDKLKEFDAQATKLTKKVEDDIKAITAALVTAQAIQVAEETVLLGLKIAENLNPLKVFFGGVEAGDIYEQTVEVARAAQELVRGSALMAGLHGVYADTATLYKDFIDNANQIKNLDKMVTAIKDNKIAEIGSDADQFIESYGAYTPKVSRSSLAKNDALWGAFKGSACDLLYGAQGVGAAAVQGVTGGMLLCEKLEGSLAEFAALRENIFDFQFDLVDALARVVRGNVAVKLSQGITVANDLLDASKLLLGFFMTQYRLQSTASLYCDKLEYLNQGRTLSQCTSRTLFTRDEIEGLVEKKLDEVTYHRDERFVYIPTRPQFDGDKGFINLPAFAKGEPVTFQLPANRTWLRGYNWLARGEVLAPFVQSFKLYLPLKEYKTGNDKEHSRTRIELASVAGSAFAGNPEVVYNLPFEDSQYVSLYTEGFDRCPSQKEIANPYSLCNNLPSICDTITRVPTIFETIMPTILSTWQVKFTKESGDEDLAWDAPNPATNLLIIAKVQLRFISGSSRRKSGVTRRRDEPAMAVGCCSGNTYRKSWRKRDCVPCPTKPPTDAVSMLRGYYCEKGDEPVAGEPPENPTQADA